MGACVVFYRSKEGDTIDLIVWRYYGRQDAALVALVLDANPGAADLGPVLPAGIRIALPEAPEPAAERGVRLWS